MPEFTVYNWEHAINNINIVVKVKGVHLKATLFINEQIDTYTCNFQR